MRVGGNAPRGLVVPSDVSSMAVQLRMTPDFAHAYISSHLKKWKHQTGTKFGVKACHRDLSRRPYVQQMQGYVGQDIKPADNH
jgi:hypothetical protein